MIRGRRRMILWIGAEEGPFWMSRFAGQRKLEERESNGLDDGDDD